MPVLFFFVVVFSLQNAFPPPDLLGRAVKKKGGVGRGAPQNPLVDSSGTIEGLQGLSYRVNVFFSPHRYIFNTFLCVPVDLYFLLSSSRRDSYLFMLCYSTNFIVSTNAGTSLLQFI